MRYSARQFYETTAYGMASPDGVAFSPDGRNLLIWNDSNGVINSYILPVAGGDPMPVTRSTTHANFAVSYFPNDESVLFCGAEAAVRSYGQLAYGGGPFGPLERFWSASR